MSESKHTPGVMVLTGYRDNGLAIKVGDEYEEIARACFINRHDSSRDNYIEELHNAARIALTWNCHDDLVEALSSIVSEQDSMGFDGSPSNDLIDKARAAIAKAEGRT